MNNLTVGIGADISNLQAGIASATSSLSGFVSGANSRLQSFGDSISGIGQKLSIGLSIPLGLLGKQALENGAGLESLKMGLKSIEEQQYGAGKSAEYAASRFSEFIEIAKLPGIGLKEAVSMSIGLRSVGFSADEAKREILAFGNTLALVGKGKNELNGVALQLQQLSGKSSGFGADLRIIKEYAPQVGAALLQAFGTLDTEAIAKTGVTGKQVIEKITTELEKLPKASAGLKTAMENVSDSVFIATGRIGEALNKSLGLTSAFDSIGNAVGTLADYFTGLSPEVQKFIGITAGVLVIAPPLLIGLGGISIALSSLSGVFLVGATAIKTFATASILGMSEFVTAVTISLAEATTAFEVFSGVLTLNPIGAAIAGIVLLGGAIYGLSKIIGSTTKEVSALQYAEQQLNEVKKANYGTFETEISKTTALVSIIKSNVRSLEEKQGALNQLIAISPKYFEGLTIEKVRAGEADEAIKKYTKSIYENAVTKGAEAKISKLAEQLVAEKDAYDVANANLQTFVSERKKLNKNYSEADARKDANGNLFQKYQVSATLVNSLDEAKKKIEQTDAALKKVSEFVAVRSVGKTVEGGSTTAPPKAKPLTDEEKNAQNKAVKDTEDLLIKLAQFKADIIEDEVKKAIDGENAKFEKEKNSIEKTKANVTVKHDTLLALEASHAKAISDIKEQAQKKESEFIINSLTNQVVKESALEQLSFEEKLKNVPKIIQGKANQQKAIELLEIQHQAKMREIKSKGGIPELKRTDAKYGSSEVREKNIFGQNTINAFQGFKTGLNLGNPLENLTNKLNAGLPKMQAVVGKNIGILTDLKNGINSSLQGGAANAARGFASVLGQLATGSAKFSDLGATLVGAASAMFADFGNLLIEKGTAMLLLDVLKKNPITGGAAMIAAGVLLSATASAGAATFSGGGSSGGGGASSYAQNYSSGSGSYGGGSQFNGGGERNQVFTINLTGKLTADGNDLSANYDRTIRQKARTYGGR